jgi:glycosyltransferase involved in cell wall biosynthesis
MNEGSPVVSVVIPTYNQAGLLDAALRSVIGQTFRDWEAIVVDNESTDATKETVENCRDPRIRYVQFPNQGIIAASRNRGIALARGEYIAFLDSDDLWYPGKLSSCLALLSQGTDALCHGMQVRTNGILTQTIVPAFAGTDLHETLLYQGNRGIITSAVMVRSAMFRHYGLFSEDPQIVTAEDYDLWLRLSGEAVTWGCLPALLGEYTVHGRNASRNVKKQQRAEEQVVLAHFAKLPAPSFYQRVRLKKRRMMIAFRAGKRVLDAGSPNDALSCAWEGITKIWR